MRSLVSTVTIDSIKEIKNSDFLVLVGFKENGWKCVTTKDSVTMGDIGLYFEVDSFLPTDVEAFEFLKKNGIQKMYTGELGMRLRTIKLRGQVSQGLYLSESSFPGFNIFSNSIQDDLGVIQYKIEPSISMDGDAIAEYPSHSPKSSQPRIQNELDFFTKYKGVAFERTMKLEGVSTSFIVNDGIVQPASHNTVYKANERFSLWTYAERIGLDKALEKLNLNVTIQGEFMGPKIQGNIENLEQNQFYVYNIFNIDSATWYSRKQRLFLIEYINFLMNNGNQLLHVPTLDESIKIFDEVDSLDELLDMANGPSMKAHLREGDVYKSLEPVDGSYVQFKVISNKYLLKEKE